MEITQNSTLEEISQAISEKNNELKKIIQAISVIQEEHYKVSKEILEKEGRKRDLSERLRKGRHAKELIKVDISQLKDLYWTKKEV